jgi:HAE1 family hydrophobic/amphiphilic exporter-1
LGAAAQVAAQEPARVGVGVIQRKLTLAEALEMALKNNLDLEIERTNVATSQTALTAARGAFDGLFRWNPTLESRNSPTSSALFGANGKLAEHFHTHNFSYLQKIERQGFSFHIDFRTRANPLRIRSYLEPYITSNLTLGFTQPLWRNRQTDSARTEIQLRSKQIDISETDLELRVIDIVTRVEEGYWNLVAARQDVQVKSENVEWAREQLARNRRMIDNGTLAPVELSAAEAELERRVDTYYSSLTLLTEVENARSCSSPADVTPRSGTMRSSPRMSAPSNCPEAMNCVRSSRPRCSRAGTARTSDCGQNRTTFKKSWGRTR